MPKVAIAYHSGFGHTKVLAEAVAAGARASADVSLVNVDDLPAPSRESGYGGEWSVLAEADAIVFGCPTYMGSVSAGFKQFMEKTSHIWLEQGWKDKIAAGFTNSGSQSGDKLNTLTSLAIFGAQHCMVWVGLDVPAGNNSTKGSVDDLNRLGSFLGAMAQSNSDQGPEDAPPAADRKTAQALGERIAKAAARWNT